MELAYQAGMKKWILSCGYLFLIVLGVGLVRAESPAEYGFGLSQDEALQGWISLFDGQTTFGWREATTVLDGSQTLLIGGRTTTEFRGVQLRGDFVNGGSITIAGRSLDVKPGPYQVSMDQGRGPIVLADELAVTKLVIRPLGLTPRFNGRDLTDWQPKQRPTTAETKRAIWSIQEGAIRAVGGPGALEYAPRDGRNLLGDLILQIEVRTRAQGTNGGLFFRNQPGRIMMGYEVQLHNRLYWLAAGQTGCWTGSIDDRQLARKLISRDFELFRMTVVAHGPHIATWVNGYQTTDWIDTRAPHDNPREGLRLEPGTLQLQAHDSETDLEFHQILVSDLPG